MRIWSTLLCLLVVLAGCGDADPPVPGAEKTAEGGTEPTSDADPPAAAPEPALDLEVRDGSYPIVWIRAGSEVEIRTEPNGKGEHVETVGRQTEFGSPTVYGVLDRVGEYAAVSTPYLENGRPGWVRLDPERLRAGSTRFAIQVDVSQREAALRKDGRIVRSFAVSVGAPGYDTPTGRYAVTDTFRGDINAAAYGCCALATTANQPNVPSGWLGGNTIAIHGTSGTLGAAISHGCVRAADEEVGNLVSRVPLGSPVFIQR